MSRSTKINCSQINIEFVKTRIDGNDFCHARITEECVVGPYDSIFGPEKRYRYESCGKYLLKGPVSHPSTNTGK